MTMTLLSLLFCIKAYSQKISGKRQIQIEKEVKKNPNKELFEFYKF